MFGFQLMPNVAPLDAVMVENREQFLFVDGQCNYWVFDAFALPERRFASPRTGRLEGDRLQEFNDSLMEQPWAAVSEQRGVEWRIWRDQFVGACGFPCDRNTTTEIMVRQARRTARELFLDATPMPEPHDARLFVSEVGILSGFDLVAWTGPTPLHELATTEAEYAARQARGERYGNFRRAMGADADELHRIRDLHRSGEANLSGGFMALEDDGTAFQVWFRDTLPFEDERGLVRPSER